MAFINRFLLLILSFSVIFPNISEAQKLLLSPSEIDESGFGYTKVIGQDDEGYFLLLSNITLNYSGDRMGFKAGNTNSPITIPTSPKNGPFL
ncbi:MAG: hypothetical protein IPG39_23090 [Bacteroidetes bacterium]|nr:hypothetical protein [Bacteroidota bacterium]